MKKILVFGASSSQNSINKQWANYVAGQIPDSEKILIDLNDFEMPIFSVDRESQIPEKALKFTNLIDQSDLIIISLAEHNGSYSAAFKNIFDWVSRIPNRTVFNNKKVLLLSTSPGARGGSTVLETAVQRFPFNGAVVVGSMSLPNFHKNFNEEKGLLDQQIMQQLKEVLGRI